MGCAGLAAQPLLAGGTAMALGLGAGDQGGMQLLFTCGTHVTARRMAVDEKDGRNSSCQAQRAAGKHQTLRRSSRCLFVCVHRRSVGVWESKTAKSCVAGYGEARQALCLEITLVRSVGTGTEWHKLWAR